MIGCRLRRQAATTLLAVLTPWCAGCATTQVRTTQTTTGPDGAGAGTLEVRVYESGSDMTHDAVTPATVSCALYRSGGSDERPVYQTTEARWIAPGLPPGDYLLRVERWLDANSSGKRRYSEQVMEVPIAAGRTTVADVLMKDAGERWRDAAFVGLIAVCVVTLLAVEVKEQLDTMSLSW